MCICCKVGNDPQVFGCYDPDIDGGSAGFVPQTPLAGSGGNPLPTAFDNWDWSSMSYRASSDASAGNGNSASNDTASYMPLDFLAFQHMYGANYNGASAGDTTYQWGVDGSLSVNGQAQPAMSANGHFLMTVWDGGGIDTYDFSLHSADQTIDLRPGEFSSFHSVPTAGPDDAAGNIANAYLYKGDGRSLIENAIAGSGDDSLTGNAISNRLEGNAGNDLLDGAGGRDLLIGGSGNDTYIVDDTGDEIVENSGEGDDTVFTSVDYQMSANVEVGHISAGAGSNVRLTGNASDNFLFGSAGNDIIQGMGGADRMQGGDGDDTYSVDNVSDAVVETAGGGNDAVYSSIDFSIAEDQEIETVILTGNAKQVHGNASDNQLIGNAADNLINGGGGTDYLLGLGGADIFQIAADASATNVIGDFSKADGDRIDLVGFNAASTTVTQVSVTSFEIRDTMGTADADDDFVQQFILRDAGSSNYTQGGLTEGTDYYFS